jgi:hypothetical protein
LNGFLLGSLLPALWFSAPLHVDSDSLLFSAVAIFLDIVFVHGIWVAWRLNRDARRGIVVVLPLLAQSLTENDQARGRPPAEPADSAGIGGVQPTGTIEILPISGTVWSVDGKPRVSRRFKVL